MQLINNKNQFIRDRKQKLRGNYYWNLNCEIERWEGDRLTHIQVTDENDELITELDIKDCKGEKEIHFRMMESFWNYYLTKKEKTCNILIKLINRFPYLTQEEHTEFCDKMLKKEKL